MSNKTEKKEDVVKKEIDYKTKWKEARENLVVQLKDHLEKSEYHKNMATKAQGALEVGDQIFAEREKSDS